jgi:hypothetical protein
MPTLSYTNVTATVALFLALGGSSYAAAKLTGADVRSGSVRGGDVRNGTLAGRDLRNGSLTTADLRDGALERADFAGVLPAGPAGPPGAPGPAGATDVVDRRAADVLLKEGESRLVTASCAPGEVALGGGAGHSGTKDDFVAIALAEPVAADGAPPDNGEPATGWRVLGDNARISGVDRTLRVHVLCARP